VSDSTHPSTAPITTLTDDLIALREIFAQFFAALDRANPNQPTERGGKGWTLHETLAHVSAVTELYYQAIDDTLNGRAFSYPGLEKRTDLRAVNAREIRARAAVPMQELARTVIEKLDQTARRTNGLTPAELALPVTICAYNRPLSVAEVIDAQLAHLGLVHAAQLANGLSARPPWIQYAPDLMLRQITRFFMLMSHAYWPEHGGSLRAAVNFWAGRGGPAWHVIIAPDGGDSGEGAIRGATMNVWTPNPEALCCQVTWQYPLVEAFFRGRLLAWGNVPLAFRFSYLFEN